VDELANSDNGCGVRKLSGRQVLSQQILCRPDGSFKYAIRVHEGKNVCGDAGFHLRPIAHSSTCSTSMFIQSPISLASTHHCSMRVTYTVEWKVLSAGFCFKAATAMVLQGRNHVWVDSGENK
jgi:hypothetical protein